MGNKNEMVESQVEDRDFLEEETTNQMRLFEDDFVAGLLAAADYKTTESKKIQIIRNNKLFFEFEIRGLSDEEYTRCKKKNTKYVRNKQLGVKMPEDTNTVKYHSALIYSATVESDREKLWDNKKVWNALESKGFQIMNGLDVIENTLLGGEKDKVIEEIDKLSGYEDNLEEVIKN